MKDKIKIVMDACAYILAVLVLLHLYLKILKESKTFRLVVSIFAWILLISLIIINVDRYLIKSGTFC